MEFTMVEAAVLVSPLIISVVLELIAHADRHIAMMYTCTMWLKAHVRAVSRAVERGKGRSGKTLATIK